MWALQIVPHRRHYVSSTEPNRLMLFGETVAVYYENRTEHTNTLCGHFSSYLIGNITSPLQISTG
jgi:hypothetical protein